ncbi:S8 family serine peptidase [Kribbella sp. HUAS MG21]|uniref:S8 family serine peptidase n=1 Tax=Kribbella sp. HUAS MG21 TaxID=3160966 RepID=A0AAU7TDY6_9ACTN
MRTRRWLAAGLAAVLGVTILPGTGQAAAARSKVVTLITGDRVVLRGADQVSIERAPGREQVTFESRRTGAEWTVIPSDVRAAVRIGRLDKRLFDVGLLFRDGYDDTARGDIPLIVSGRPAVRRATKVRELDSATALAVPKHSAAGFLAQTPGKIWLDRKLRMSLDHSVPQIGTPTAWKAGYTGKGVKVAVLDSGIDSTHPDLAGQVVAAKNFTPSPAADVAGHGTHVASTIAGKGVSGYRGVAPDAQLLDGKVCDDHGDCSESAVLAGIEWAVAQHAPVVNLSLGSPGGDEIDPIEEAVDRLTRTTGTLFVVAAGNRGGAKSVESPGTAAAALTVGAVDGKEALADFSGQGPGAAGAVKPDITAPGVGIVAARSAGAVLGEPVGERYSRMSGTSMATPHVSGAAALLVQQHATWKAPELKSALMSAAKPNAALTSYEQGAGRVDVTRVVAQSVVATTGSISFGTALWPHADDKPVSKALTYRNLGTVPITLDVKAELSVGGKPAPAGALRLSADRLTVPAGGEASVQVVSETTHAGVDGVYSGRVTATGGSQQVVVPLVVDKEIESYDVALRVLGPDGAPVPADRGYVSFWNVGSGTTVDATGRTTARVPRGRQILEATIFGAKGELYRMVEPGFDVRRATAVTIDARRAKPVTVSVPRPDASGFVGFVGYHYKSGGQELLTWQLRPRLKDLYVGRIGNRQDADFTAFLVSYLGKLKKDGTLDESPYVYGLVDTRPAHFFNGVRRNVASDRQLAEVVAHYNGPAGTAAFWGLAAPRFKLMPIGAGIKLPSSVHYHLEPRTTWQQDLNGNHREPRQYNPGTTTHETWTVSSDGPAATG